MLFASPFVTLAGNTNGGTAMTLCKRRINYFAVVSALVVACKTVLVGGCGSHTTPTPGQWQSQHFDVSTLIPDGWRQTYIAAPGDTFDRPDNVVMAFVNDPGPYGYIIKLEKDVPLDRLSMERYLNANCNQYTSHPAYELIDEALLTTPVPCPSRAPAAGALRTSCPAGKPVVALNCG